MRRKTRAPAAMSQPATQPPSQPPDRVRRDWNASASLLGMPSLADVQRMLQSVAGARPAQAGAPQARFMPVSAMVARQAALKAKAAAPPRAAEASDSDAYVDPRAPPRGHNPVQVTWPATVGASLADEAGAPPRAAKVPARPRAPLLALDEGVDEEEEDKAAERLAAARQRAYVATTAAKVRAVEVEVDAACLKCGKTECGQGQAAMVLCDGYACDAGLHLACGKLRAVPAGQWFCPRCDKMRQDGVPQRELDTLPLRTLRAMFECFVGAKTASGNSAWLRRRLALGLRGAAAAAARTTKKRGARMRLGVPGAAPRAAPSRRDDDDFDAKDVAEGSDEPEEEEEEAELAALAGADFIVPSPAQSPPSSEPVVDDLEEEEREARGGAEEEEEDADEIEDDEPPPPPPAAKRGAKRAAGDDEPAPAPKAKAGKPAGKPAAAKAAQKAAARAKAPPPPPPPAQPAKKSKLELKPAGKGSKAAAPEKRSSARNAKPEPPAARRTRGGK